MVARPHERCDAAFVISSSSLVRYGLAPHNIRFVTVGLVQIIHFKIKIDLGALVGFCLGEKVQAVETLRGDGPKLGFNGCNIRYMHMKKISSRTPSGATLVRKGTIAMLSAAE